MTEKVHDCLILKMTRDRCHMLIDQGKTEICYFGDIIDFLMTVAINPRLLGQRDQIRFWLKWNVQFLETWNLVLLILFLLPFLYSTPFHLFPRCSGSDWNFNDSYSLSFWCRLGGALRRANQSTRWKQQFVMVGLKHYSEILLKFGIFDNFSVHLHKSQKWVHQVEFGSKSVNVDWNNRSKCIELIDWIILGKIPKFSKTVSAIVISIKIGSGNDHFFSKNISFSSATAYFNFST